MQFEDRLERVLATLDAEARRQPVVVEPAPYRCLETAAVRQVPREDTSYAIEYLRMIWRRKLVILAATCLAGLGVLLWTARQTPVYQAGGSLEIQTLNENFLNLRDVDPTAGPGIYSADSYLQTQLKILKSRALIERVLDRLEFEKRAGVEGRPAGRSRLASLLGMPETRAVPARERALADVMTDLSVKVARQTRLVEMSFDAPEPQLAADFINTLAQEFISQNLEARWKSTVDTSDFLSRQLSELKIRLEKSEDQLQAYARANNLIYTSDRDSLAETRLRQLQQDVAVAQADRVAKQSQYEMAASAPLETLSDVVNDPTLRDYQVKLTDLRRQLAELTSVLTPAHSRVERMRAQIAEMEASIQRTRQNIAARMRNDYQTALRRENLLSASYANQMTLVTDQSSTAVRYNILKREVETNRQIYDALLQKVKEAGMAAAMRANHIRIVDRATPPPAPYKPSLGSMLPAGLMAGMILGVGLATVLERTDRKFHRPGDAATYLGLPELGTIPAAGFAPKLALALRQAPSGCGFGIGGTGIGQQTELITWQKKTSALAESFRSALTSILLGAEGGTRPAVLVVTSAAPGEGKSTVTSNLAIALAQLNYRVLLIDADLRTPRQHRVFGLENGRGLSDWLRTPSFDRNGFASTPVLETKIPNLWLMPSGSPTSDPHSLLYSDAMAELLHSVRSRFDIALIDTPPMLHLADARVLARHSDAVVLVVRLGATEREAASAALQRFSADRTPVMGVIINDWNPGRNPYGGYYATERKADPSEGG
jgi:polysaccharide biosynthesis transport protein